MYNFKPCFPIVFTPWAFPITFLSMIVCIYHCIWPTALPAADWVEGVTGAVHVESDADRGQGRECEAGSLQVSGCPRGLHWRQRQVQTGLTHSSVGHLLLRFFRSFFYAFWQSVLRYPKFTNWFSILLVRKVFWIHYYSFPSNIPSPLQSWELLVKALRDSSQLVVSTTYSVLLPAVAAWAFELDSLESDMLSYFLHQMVTCIKVCHLLSISKSTL